MTTKVTICYCTSRPDPAFDRFLSSLRAQVQPTDEIDLVVVDSLLGKRPLELLAKASWSSLFHFVEVTLPYPTVWQGSRRVTQRDWWALGAARNTALVLARRDYVAFVDDRCTLGPGWLASVRKGERDRASVLAGSYEKTEHDPNFIDPETGARGRSWTTTDARLRASPRGAVNVPGGWCFGCTFALPLTWALDVNGHEGGVDGLGGEDSVFGAMLVNSGRRIDFVPGLFVSLDRPVGTDHGCRRIDKGKSPADKSHAALKRFATRMRTEEAFTPNLRELRSAEVAGAGLSTEPTWGLLDADGDPIDWFDGQKIKEMT